MNIDVVEAITLIVAIAGVLISIFKAPGERDAANMDAQESASIALKNYSEEIVRLRNEIVECAKNNSATQKGQSQVIRDLSKRLADCEEARLQLKIEYDRAIAAKQKDQTA